LLGFAQRVALLQRQRLGHQRAHTVVATRAGKRPAAVLVALAAATRARRIAVG